jgi:hypothetical protein
MSRLKTVEAPQLRSARYGMALLLVVACLPAPGWAQDDTELAKKAQNPIADMISVPFQSNINFGVGPQDGVQYILSSQPVIPFHLVASAMRPP